jgi:Protein of unknown function DUF262/Protein of unknown function (DUF1524)
MDANAVPLLNLFERKVRLEIPLFQRQYVWSASTQWEPLWEDVSRKFVEQLDGRTDAPPHFLGAMVLDQKLAPITHVEKRQVIDGQQRLTTLQIFLAAFRDFAELEGCTALSEECSKYLLNSGMMANPQIEQFKVWPTQLDREQFGAVILTKSRAGIEARFPLTRRKWARQYDPRPRMIEAYLYFSDAISAFFKGDETSPPLLGEQPLASRLETAFHALRSALRVVVIELGKDDDPQVIFETLNARGEPLLPADLMRNYVFLRAAREGDDQEKLYEEYWKTFDDPFWRVPTDPRGQGRPLSDLYMQYFVSSRRCVDVAVKHLYVEYKYWIEKERPFPHARDELATLSRQGADFRRLVSPPREDVVEPLATFLRLFELGTAYPFLLAFLDASPSDEQVAEMSAILQSYIVRRTVCGLTTKNYNRLFLQLTRALKGSPITPARTSEYLASLSGYSVEWPTDERFQSAWLSLPVYQLVSSSRLCHILERMNDTFYTSKIERITIQSPLSIEHLMPQNWLEFWPLPDGSTGMNWAELQTAAPEDPRANATRNRDTMVHTMGNLTILTQALNSAVSNSAWSDKRSDLLAASLLPINLELRDLDEWSEDSIRSRGERLYGVAASIWTRPKAVP